MSMIYKNETMSWGSNPTYKQVAGYFYNYLNQYDNRFTLDSDAGNITFDSKFTVQFSNGAQYYQPKILSIICSDTSQTTIGSFTTSGDWRNKSSVNVLFIKTDELLYIKVYINSSDYLGFVWLKDKNNIDYVAGMSSGYQSINSLDFRRATTNSIVPFKLSPFFNFPIPVGNVYFFDKCVIVSNTGEDMTEVADWCNCSTLTPHIIITIQGKNYYTLGANTLMPFNTN